MPTYNTLNPPPFLTIGHPSSRKEVFKAETVVADEYSQQISVPMAAVAGQKGIRIEIDHSANPGNCEYYLMESSADYEYGKLGYQQVPSNGDVTQALLTTGPNGATTRIGVDLLPFAGEFFCIYVKTAPSNASIKVSARVSRIA